MLQIPTWLLRMIFVFIGISLGAVVTPETLHGMATYPLSIAVLLVTMACVGYFGATYLRLVHGWDTAAAYLAAAPGGLSQVMAIAAEIGVDPRGIAFDAVHPGGRSIAVSMPAGLTLFGLVGHGTSSASPCPFNPALLGELAIWSPSRPWPAIAAYRIRFPGGLLFGAVRGIGGAARQRANPCRDALVGDQHGDDRPRRGHRSRFAGTPLRLLLCLTWPPRSARSPWRWRSRRYSRPGWSNFLPLPLRIAEVMIAFAPGSVDAMMLLALALISIRSMSARITSRASSSYRWPCRFIVRRAALARLADKVPKEPLKPQFRPPPFQD